MDNPSNSAIDPGAGASSPLGYIMSSLSQEELRLYRELLMDLDPAEAERSITEDSNGFLRLVHLSTPSQTNTTDASAGLRHRRTPLGTVNFELPQRSNLDGEASSSRVFDFEEDHPSFGTANTSRKRESFPAFDSTDVTDGASANTTAHDAGGTAGHSPTLPAQLPRPTARGVYTTEDPLPTISTNSTESSGVLGNENVTSMIERSDGNFQYSPMAPFRASSSAADIEIARGVDLYKIHSVEFELNVGDTLVFIDFPKTRSDVRRLVNCGGIGYRDQHFRVHSEKLLATGSSKFAEFFAPTYQFRTMRRRKLVNKLPEGIKYVIDLTPPTEGEEIVFQMTELSLTPGIMKWWSSSLEPGVDHSLVTGHDDICSCKIAKRSEGAAAAAAANVATAKEDGEDRPSSSSGTTAPESVPPKVFPRWPIDHERLLQMKARGENETYPTPEFRIIPDYCPFRHCNGIIRLLMIIEGHSVSLDSAARVWTLVALAKIFDCAPVIQMQVEQWIMSGSNTRFIEILPEEALQIGHVLKIKDVTESSFRILVNEFALKEAADKDKPASVSNRLSIFGRVLGDLPDELSNIIQHAARALVDRITALYDQIQNQDMFDFWDITAWNRLRAIEQVLSCLSDSDIFVKGARTRLKILMDVLPHRVTCLVDNALSINFEAGLLKSIDTDRASYMEPKHFENVNFILKGLNKVQIMLTALPYMALCGKLESHLYWGAVSEHKDARYKPFGDILMDAQMAIERLVRNRPAVADMPEWKELLQIPPSAGIGWRLMPLPKSLIEWDQIDREVKDVLRPLLQTVWIRHFTPPLNITRHLLLNLDPKEELKFLPLWAGGLDDGTGGVFEHFLPPATMGPNGPGPAFHTGMSIPSAPGSISSSLMEEIAAMRVVGSTTAGSIDVHDSISTVYNRNRVVSDSESIATESFTDGTTEFQNARFRVPADHQDISHAMRQTVESGTEDTNSVTTEQIIGGESDDHDMYEEDEEGSDSGTETGSVVAAKDMDEDEFDEDDFDMLEDI